MIDPKTLPYDTRIALAAIRDRDSQIRELREQLERARNRQTEIHIVIGIPPIRSWVRRLWIWLRVKCHIRKQPYF